MVCEAIRLPSTVMAPITSGIHHLFGPWVWKPQWKRPRNASSPPPRAPALSSLPPASHPLTPPPVLPFLLLLALLPKSPWAGGPGRWPRAPPSCGPQSPPRPRARRRRRPGAARAVRGSPAGLRRAGRTRAKATTKRRETERDSSIEREWRCAEKSELATPSWMLGRNVRCRPWPKASLQPWPACGPGRKYGAPVSGRQQQLVSPIGGLDQRTVFPAAHPDGFPGVPAAAAAAAPAGAAPGTAGLGFIEPPGS